MCGIYGVSYGPEGPGAELWTPTELLQIMFPAIIHRGPHAYGWMYYDGEHIYSYKAEGRADTDEAIDSFSIPDNVKWFVAHVRYATHGSPSYMGNNHPMQHGNIIGVHNGVLYNHERILSETGRQDPKAEVDSEAIFAAIHNWGHRAGLRKIQGNMVAVYANIEKPEVLHFARSHGRPLEFCKTEAGSLMFASESLVIDATGMNATAYSSLGTNRLIRAKLGKIVERITYKTTTPDPTGPEYGNDWRVWINGIKEKASRPRPSVTSATDGPIDHGQYYGPDGKLHDRLYTPPQPPRTPNQNRKQPPVIDVAHPTVEPPVDPPPPAPKPTPPKSRGYSRVSSQYKDGDRIGTKVFYRGLLVTEDEYFEAMAPKRHTNGEAK